MRPHKQKISGTDRFPQPLQEGLEVRNLRFRYPEGTEDVLEDINFHARLGEIISIVGVNGAGKSTADKIVAWSLRARCGYNPVMMA